MAATTSAREAVEAAMLASPALLLNEALDVLGHLELLAAVPTASVDGDHAVTVHDAHLVEIGKHHERAAGPVMRNGVVVEVETDVGRLSDLDLHALVRRERLGQWEQNTALLFERLSHRTRPILDP